MIIDKILSNCEKLDTKIAMSYLGKHISYSDLKIAIEKESVSLDENVIIIRNGNAVISIIQFLAAALNKNKVIIVPKEWDENFPLVEETNSKKSFEIGILSSGSSGEAKLIWKSNNNWEAAFQHQSDLFGIGEKDKVFVLDALSYSANLNSVIHALWCGASVCFDRLANASNWPETVVKEKVSSIFLVPSHWNLLLNRGKSFAHVKSCVSAGEKLNGKQAKGILETFPNTMLTEYYGAAELGHISYIQGEELINSPHSVGRVFPGVNLKIIDQQIHVKSPYVANAFLEKGSVGDLGYIENDLLILLGREGRMFNKRGVNVFAQEIEQVILLHPQVKMAHLHGVNVLSIPKLELLYDTFGQADVLDEAELWELLNLKISKAKHPHFLKRVLELPTNSNGKISIGQLSKKLDEEAVVFS
jgi:long-chain acyl-CoA synthetase